MSFHFDALFSGPETDVSLVVSYPDMIYHARYQAAAAVSYRYRYALSDVRSKHDLTLIRGTVFLDGQLCARFLRIEYRASRLNGLVRAAGRNLGNAVLAWLRLDDSAEATVRLHHCAALGAYHVELWDTLAAPDGGYHDHAVLGVMGRDAVITRPASLALALGNVTKLRHVEIAFREPDRTWPDGWPISNPQWDNNFQATIQVPHSPLPDDSANVEPAPNYFIDFARGFFRPAGSVPATRFRNWQMTTADPEASAENVASRRWLVQREFAGRMVYCFEGTLPPGAVEGCHRHVGAEEVLYFVAGEGLAYVAMGDLPDAELLTPTVRPVFGIGDRPCWELSVGPGAMLYTKSGGVHGLRNNTNAPLTYLAFLYQTD